MEVLGIPVQSMLDTLLFITNPDVHNIQTVEHCGGNVVLFVKGENTPCQPVDQTQFPNWKCAYSEGSWDYHDHHGCSTLNGLGPVYFCECPELFEGEMGDLRIANYFLISKRTQTTNTYCNKCANSHAKPQQEPCSFCGEVHD